jgi:hypothetical protein
MTTSSIRRGARRTTRRPPHGRSLRPKLYVPRQYGRPDNKNHDSKPQRHGPDRPFEPRVEADPYSEGNAPNEADAESTSVTQLRTEGLR